MKRILLTTLAIVSLAATQAPVQAASSQSMIGINVVLKTDVSPGLLADLGKIGNVRDVIYPIRALTMQVRADQLKAVQGKPYVAAANPDAERNTGPEIRIAADPSFKDGLSTWDLDMITVTDYGKGRTVEQDGSGVYVAVLDTGLVDNWRYYFYSDRIATEYARCFGGGGGEVGFVSSQPNKWEHDQNSHGTHVTSTILGYNLLGIAINGVAPMANVIPVKVLNQNGSGWSSVIARGISYVADLKAGPLADHPVVINMSLGGPDLDAMEQAAIDRAIKAGVIIVASAGNGGNAGMGYPGAYAPVISVAAAGWGEEWNVEHQRDWWHALDVPEDLGDDAVYITDFSSRAKAGQDLDVAAPGSWIVGPYQKNGQVSYYFLGGTSMASPHVVGVVALMLQKDSTMDATGATSILQSTAWEIPGVGSEAQGAGLVDATAALDKIP